MLTGITHLINTILDKIGSGDHSPEDPDKVACYGAVKNGSMPHLVTLHLLHVSAI